MSMNAKPSAISLASTLSLPTSALSPIVRSQTATQEVERRIILAIARGDKQPGERVTEAEISSALKVSRVPAREALQKLFLSGVLVKHGIRGLRVADFSPQRVSELLQLRMAIEKIFFENVLHPDFDRAPLLAALEGIIEEMVALSGSGDAVMLSGVDLKFHRTIAIHSGNVLGANIWEGLAQHMLIVFCRGWEQAADRTGEVELHRRIISFLRNGDARNLDDLLQDHLLSPANLKYGS